MPKQELELTILTPQKNIFRGSVETLKVPSYKGYLGLLVNHAPIICLLKAGNITAQTNDQLLKFTTSGGLMEVLDNKVTILADSVAVSPA
jgi:F-type H+-transporting ATPase subunit epsilon